MNGRRTPWDRVWPIMTGVLLRCGLPNIFGFGWVRQACRSTPTQIEPLSELLVSPLITPIVVPYIILYISPLRSLDYNTDEHKRMAAAEPILLNSDCRLPSLLWPTAAAFGSASPPERSFKHSWIFGYRLTLNTNPFLKIKRRPPSRNVRYSAH